MVAEGRASSGMAAEGRASSGAANGAGVEPWGTRMRSARVLVGEPDSTTSVLVHGAGAAGLLLALCLTEFGVRARVVDARSERLDVHAAASRRPVVLSPRTMSVLRQVPSGAFYSIRQAGNVQPTGSTRVSVVNGRLSGEPAEVRTTEAPFLRVGMAQLEKALEFDLSVLGVKVEWGTEIESLSSDSEGVRVELRRGDEQEVVQAQYVAAADAAEACVALTEAVESAGITYERAPTRFSGMRHATHALLPLGLQSVLHVPRTLSLVADCSVHWPLPPGPSYRLSFKPLGSKGPTVRSATVATVPDAHDGTRALVCVDAPVAMCIRWAHGGVPHTSPSLDDVAARLQHMAPPGTRVDNLRWSAYCRVGQRIATSFRAGPRVLLLGDAPAGAAHSLDGGSPAFEGANLGLQEAQNLAWKLALVLHNQSSDALIDTYDDEAHAMVEECIGTTKRGVRSADVPLSAGDVFPEVRGVRDGFKDVDLLNLGLRHALVALVSNEEAANAVSSELKRCTELMRLNVDVVLVWRPNSRISDATELVDTARELELRVFKNCCPCSPKTCCVGVLVRPDGVLATAPRSAMPDADAGGRSEFLEELDRYATTTFLLGG